MIFSDCKVFREAIREYFLLSRKEVTFTRNEKYKLKAVCKALKTHKPEKFLPRIQSNPTIPPQSIVNAASSEFKVGISRMIEGSVAEQYTMLWDYCHELEDKNLGSTTKMQCEFVDGETVFKRLYICLEQLMRGFKMNCRLFIGLDACHLKGVYGGQLLTAVRINPNNETWVLAYAVVEMETRESWTCFIDLLAKDVDIVNSHGWAFISNKQKGLPGAFEDIVPNAETRFCVRHLWDNFNKTYKGKVLRDQLWTCARATNVPCFKYQMENNLCESFNNSIKTARDMPIITMLEMIRCLLMRRIQWRRDKMSNWPHQICKNIFDHVQQKKLEVCNCTVQWSGGPKYQVYAGRGDQYVVDLDNHTCSCRKWDLLGIPCAHGIAAIHYKRGKAVEDYVHSYYSKDSYMALYNNLIMPINGSQLWEKTNQTAIKPPAYTRQPGRPRKLRIKGAEERINKTGKKWLGRQGMQMRCSICGSTGHNKTTHHRNLPQKEKPLSRGKGRPRKISNQDLAIAADEAKVAARVRRKLAYARAKAAAAAKKAALNASQPNAAETA
ncbi:uncharacterized protein LOC117621734 [Prunus dulcis]|uniref:uncharacterized protein LOC117621734 n=1 Tax=Prunus dulcis TaxID=3755 RepID=UPI00148304E8|nr:uncharacterized protein LOC117621734 [Prunus dulcis]